ncbi:MAG TPA: hypothetical protein DEP72_07800 [Clostridiales bacterium]|nr:MAG: hypothetical protein A2Y18_06680 [Clostridiales bacterium GWD2_32_19]HCC08040.1 hypothetical protein [Clostridiales bacterium]
MRNSDNKHLSYMQTTELFDEFNEMQLVYGDANLDAIYGCGEINNPKVCLVFMNPTARNVASDKNWTGIKAPWIGTKNVWNMFYQLGLIDKDTIEQINFRKPLDWDYQFVEEVYKKVYSNSMYITNLSKATQIDARALPNDVFKKYTDLFKQEINSVNPRVIITFGNQVSSVLLNKDIKVSEYRKRYEMLEIKGVLFKVFPVYYPVGQGMRNIKMAKEDIEWILNENEI